MGFEPPSIVVARGACDVRRCVCEQLADGEVDFDVSLRLTNPKA
jgi:hypothetical protein